MWVISSKEFEKVKAYQAAKGRWAVWLLPPLAFAFLFFGMKMHLPVYQDWKRLKPKFPSRRKVEWAVPEEKYTVELASPKRFEPAIASIRAQAEWATELDSMNWRLDKCKRTRRQNGDVLQTSRHTGEKRFP